MKNKRLIIVLSIVLGVLLVTAIIFLVVRSKKSDSVIIPEITQTIEPSVLPSVVASPNVTKTSTKTTTQTVTQTTTPVATATKSASDLISAAIAAKYSQPVTSLTISKQSENAAYGDFSFSNEGGFFVAVKVGSDWKIIADGNGTIECSVLDANNVPASVVSECYDTSTESSKTR